MTCLANKRLPIHMVFLLASLSLCATGCGSTNRIMDTDPESLASSVSIGDHVIVETKGGEAIEFDVTDIDESGIWFGARHIPYSDIQSVEVRSDQAKNSNALLIVGAVALVIAAVWLVSEIDSGFDEGLFQQAD